jgi:asparagine synthase (glutamine-hydrolysing)
MCGIAGLASGILSSDQLEQNLDNLLASIRHRGPDETGRFSSASLAMGMTRLSIIDLENGTQPKRSANGNITVIFNGEIYNHPQLRDELISLGYQFTSNSDTEVIAHGYAHWQEGLFERLEGMFAIAIYNKEAQTLTLVRDHFGIKPLYYHHSDSNFAFSSEPHSLYELEEIQLSIKAETISEFLTFKYLQSPSHFVSGIHKLEPGHYLELDLRTYTHKKKHYWSLNEFLEAQPKYSTQDWLEGAYDALQKTVDNHLLSDVPVGVLLSGGIDSALLAWAASESKKTTKTSAFTTSFSEKAYDESALARKTAEKLNLEHHILSADLQDFDSLDLLVKQFGEPFANLSIPANFALAKHTAQHVKVALNGSGSDELFYGYDRYVATDLPLPKWLNRSLKALSPLIDTLPSGHHKNNSIEKIKRYLSLVKDEIPLRHFKAIRLFDLGELTQAFPHIPHPKPFHYMERFEKYQGEQAIKQASLVDIETMLPDDYLTLVDRTSMAYSLEVRVPFIDLNWVKFALQVPKELKRKRFQSKILLRKMAENKLPSVITQGAKQGFESPIAHWIKNIPAAQWRERFENSELKHVCDIDYLEKLFTLHNTGRRNMARELLAVITLESWIRQCHVTLK